MGKSRPDTYNIFYSRVIYVLLTFFEERVWEKWLYVKVLRDKVHNIFNVVPIDKLLLDFLLCLKLLIFSLLFFYDEI